jgi:hypothetical protein
MRSPTPSWRSDLSSYQGRLIDMQKTAPPGTPQQHAAILIETVNRWIKHKEAERVWNTFRSHVPPDSQVVVVVTSTAVMPIANITPSGLVGMVIRSRFDADKFSQIIDDAGPLEQKIRARAKRHQTRTSSPEALEVASDLLGTLATFKRQRAAVLRRQRSAPRTWFIQHWSGFFKDLCGQPLEEVVRFFTEIAFNDPAVTIETIKAARRSTQRR